MAASKLTKEVLMGLAKQRPSWQQTMLRIKDPKVPAPNVSTSFVRYNPIRSFDIPKQVSIPFYTDNFGMTLLDKVRGAYVC